MSRDLLIAGVMKAGTTSLFKYLAAHPLIAPSAVKETHYYADDLRDHFAFNVRTEEDVVAERKVNPDATFHHARIRSREVYDSLFPVNEHSRVRMEASPSYLPSAVAAGRIAAEAVAPLVIVVLRNPYERLISHYEMNKAHGITSEQLEIVLRDEVEQGLPLVRNGQVALARLSLYADAVERLIETVGSEQVYVVRTESLESEAKCVIGAICDRLGLYYEAGMLGEEKQHNRTLEPRAPIFNRLLNQAGLFQVARRIAPDSVKRRLIYLYYKQRRRELKQYDNALRIVEPYINEDLERLSIMLKDDYTGWVL